MVVLQLELVYEQLHSASSELGSARGQQTDDWPSGYDELVAATGEIQEQMAKIREELAKYGNSRRISKDAENFCEGDTFTLAQAPIPMNRKRGSSSATISILRAV